MIITLTGTNSYKLRVRLSEIATKFASEYGDLAVERIEGAEASLEQVKEAVSGPGLLANKKLVVLYNPADNKDLAENVEQIISSILTDTELVIYEPNLDKRTSFYKTLKAKTNFGDYPELDESGLAGWLVGEAQSQEGSISLADARYMVNRLGVSQLLLANELAKLITYTPKVSKDSIDLLSVKAPQGKLFDLLDAAFSGNKSKALELYEEQRLQRVEPQEIIAMLAWQLRMLSVVKLAGNKSSTEIAKDLSMSPYPLGKAKGLASQIDGAKLRRLVGQALLIDQKAKSSALDLDEALKTYIVSI